MSKTSLPFSSSLILFIGAIAILTHPSSSSLDTYVFGGCTPLKYAPDSPYDSNLNLLLHRLVGAATSAAYANLTAPQDTIYALFQCRGDLSPADCSHCVAGALTRLATLCPDSCGGALQLDGCFVKYDNQSFFGVDDKTVVVKKCGPSIGSDLAALTGLDAALAYLVSGGGTYRDGGAADVRSVAQCVGDLSVTDCQDCISDAIGRLKSACAQATWGDLFLAKCYARFTRSAFHAQGNGNGYGYDGNQNNDSKDDNNQTSKTLAIIIGLIAGVALLVIFITWLNKRCEKARGCK